MSVKFQKETIRNAPIPGGVQTDIVKKVSETITGADAKTAGKGKPGYLAVRSADYYVCDGSTERVTGIP